jgi:5-methylcytosine-specific restriction endonuclease McrA
MATLSAGLRPQHKKAVITEVLPSGYKVRCDGEEGERRLSEKKVKRLGKPFVKPKVLPDDVLSEEEAAEHNGMFPPIPDARTLRDQRPPTRLRIPDANVPMIPLEAVRKSGLFVDQFQDRSHAFLPQPKPRKPSRSAAYLQHVREHDCCNCGAPGPSDPDHVGSRGVGQKTSDFNCVPLCRTCHRYRTDKNVLPDSPTINGVTYECTKSATENRILRAQVQMLREWAEKIEKEIP